MICKGLLPAIIVFYIATIFTYPMFDTDKFSRELDYIGKRLFLPQVNLFTNFGDRYWALSQILIVGVDAGGVERVLYNPPPMYITGLSRDLTLLSIFINFTRLKEIPMEEEIEKYLEGKLILNDITARTRLRINQFDIKYTRKEDLIKFVKKLCHAGVEKTYIKLRYLSYSKQQIERKVFLRNINCD